MEFHYEYPSKNNNIQPKEELDKLLLSQNYDRFQFRLEHVLDLYDLSIEDGIK